MRRTVCISSLTKTPTLTVPAGCVVVAESGIRNRADIEYLQKAGIGAFLIGEGLVTAPDAGDRLRQFLGMADDAG